MRDILCAPVQDYPALVKDPQVLHNRIVGEVKNRDGVSIPMIKSPMTVEGLAPRYTPPPSLGEHTLEVLRDELSMKDGEIAAVLKSKAAIADGAA